MFKQSLKIFDVDGTVSPIAPDPNTTFIEPDFVKYVVEDEHVYPHTNIILTGREDQRVYKECNNHPIDVILEPVLKLVNMTILSSHGLVCYTYDGKIDIHPQLAESQDLIKILHSKIEELVQKIHNDLVIIERKFTGVNMNANQVKDDKERERILTVFKSIYEPLVVNSHLKIAKEDGALEIRPFVGKLQGLTYFIHKGLVHNSECFTFFCDSLEGAGTDKELAEYLIKDKQIVVQVLNNKPELKGVYKSYPTSKEMASALLNKQVF